MKLRAKPTSYRTTTVPDVADPYAVPPEGPAQHLRNALQILQDINPLEQGAQQVNEGILAAEARVITALALVETKAVPQADGSGT